MVKKTTRAPETGKSPSQFNPLLPNKYAVQIRQGFAIFNSLLLGSLVLHNHFKTNPKDVDPELLKQLKQNSADLDKNFFELFPDLPKDFSSTLLYLPSEAEDQFSLFIINNPYIASSNFIELLTQRAALLEDTMVLTKKAAKSQKQHAKSESADHQESLTSKLEKEYQAVKNLVGNLPKGIDRKTLLSAQVAKLQLQLTEYNQCLEQLKGNYNVTVEQQLAEARKGLSAFNIIDLQRQRHEKTDALNAIRRDFYQERKSFEHVIDTATKALKLQDDIKNVLENIQKFQDQPEYAAFKNVFMQHKKTFESVTDYKLSHIKKPFNQALREIQIIQNYIDKIGKDLQDKINRKVEEDYQRKQREEPDNNEEQVVTNNAYIKQIIHPAIKRILHHFPMHLQFVTPECVAELNKLAFVDTKGTLGYLAKIGMQLAEQEQNYYSSLNQSLLSIINKDAAEFAKEEDPAQLKILFEQKVKDTVNGFHFELSSNDAAAIVDVLYSHWIDKGQQDIQENANRLNQLEAAFLIDYFLPAQWKEIYQKLQLEISKVETLKASMMLLRKLANTDDALKTFSILLERVEGQYQFLLAAKKIQEQQAKQWIQSVNNEYKNLRDDIQKILKRIQVLHTQLSSKVQGISITQDETTPLAYVDLQKELSYLQTALNNYRAATDKFTLCSQIENLVGLSVTFDPNYESSIQDAIKKVQVLLEQQPSFGNPSNQSAVFRDELDLLALAQVLPTLKTDEYLAYRAGKHGEHESFAVGTKTIISSIGQPRIAALGRILDLIEKDNDKTTYIFEWLTKDNWYEAVLKKDPSFSARFETICLNRLKKYENNLNQLITNPKLLDEISVSSWGQYALKNSASFLQKYRELNDKLIQKLATDIDSIYRHIFAKVTPDELINFKVGNIAASPNLFALATMLNQFSALVSNSVIKQEQADLRALMLERWVWVMDACLKRSDFQAFFAISAGLEVNAIVHLLPTLVKGLSVEAKAKYQELTKLRKNYHDARQAGGINAYNKQRAAFAIFNSIDQVVIPFFGDYSSNIEFASGKYETFEKNPATNKAMKLGFENFLLFFNMQTHFHMLQKRTRDILPYVSPINTYLKNTLDATVFNDVEGNKQLAKFRNDAASGLIAKLNKGFTKPIQAYNVLTDLRNYFTRDKRVIADILNRLVFLKLFRADQMVEADLKDIANKLSSRNPAEVASGMTQLLVDKHKANELANYLLIEQRRIALADVCEQADAIKWKAYILADANLNTLSDEQQAEFITYLTSKELQINLLMEPFSSVIPQAITILHFNSLKQQAQQMLIGELARLRLAKFLDTCGLINAAAELHHGANFIGINSLLGSLENRELNLFDQLSLLVKLKILPAKDLVPILTAENHRSGVRAYYQRQERDDLVTLLNQGDSLRTLYLKLANQADDQLLFDAQRLMTSVAIDEVSAILQNWGLTADNTVVKGIIDNNKKLSSINVAEDEPEQEVLDSRIFIADKALELVELANDAEEKGATYWQLFLEMQGYYFHFIQLTDETIKLYKDILNGKVIQPFNMDFVLEHQLPISEEQCLLLENDLKRLYGKDAKHSPLIPQNDYNFAQEELKNLLVNNTATAHEHAQQLIKAATNLFAAIDKFNINFSNGLPEQQAEEAYQVFLQLAELKTKWTHNYTAFYTHLEFIEKQLQSIADLKREYKAIIFSNHFARDRTVNKFNWEKLENYEKKLVDQKQHAANMLKDFGDFPSEKSRLSKLHQLQVKTISRWLHQRRAYLKEDIIGPIHKSLREDVYKLVALSMALNKVNEEELAQLIKEHISLSDILSKYSHTLDELHNEYTNVFNSNADLAKNTYKEDLKKYEQEIITCQEEIKTLSQTLIPLQNFLNDLAKGKMELVKGSAVPNEERVKKLELYLNSPHKEARDKALHEADSWLNYINAELTKSRNEIVKKTTGQLKDFFKRASSQKNWNAKEQGKQFKIILSKIDHYLAQQKLFNENPLFMKMVAENPIAKAKFERVKKAFENFKIIKRAAQIRFQYELAPNTLHKLASRIEALEAELAAQKTDIERFKLLNQNKDKRATLKKYLAVNAKNYEQLTASYTELLAYEKDKHMQEVVQILCEPLSNVEKSKNALAVNTESLLKLTTLDIHLERYLEQFAKDQTEGLLKDFENIAQETVTLKLTQEVVREFEQIKQTYELITQQVNDIVQRLESLKDKPAEWLNVWNTIQKERNQIGENILLLMQKDRVLKQKIEPLVTKTVVAELEAIRKSKLSSAMIKLTGQFLLLEDEANAKIKVLADAGEKVELKTNVNILRENVVAQVKNPHLRNLLMAQHHIPIDLHIVAALNQIRQKATINFKLEILRHATGLQIEDDELANIINADRLLTAFEEWENPKTANEHIKNIAKSNHKISQVLARLIKESQRNLTIIDDVTLPALQKDLFRDLPKLLASKAQLIAKHSCELKDVKSQLNKLSRAFLVDSYDDEAIKKLFGAGNNITSALKLRASLLHNIEELEAQINPIEVQIVKLNELNHVQRDWLRTYAVRHLNEVNEQLTGYEKALKVYLAGLCETDTAQKIHNLQQLQQLEGLLKKILEQLPEESEQYGTHQADEINKARAHAKTILEKIPKNIASQLHHLQPRWEPEAKDTFKKPSVTTTHTHYEIVENPTSNIPEWKIERQVILRAKKEPALYYETAKSVVCHDMQKYVYEEQKRIIHEMCVREADKLDKNAPVYVNWENTHLSKKAVDKAVEKACIVLAALRPDLTIYANGQMFRISRHSYAIRSKQEQLKELGVLNKSGAIIKERLNAEMIFKEEDMQAKTSGFTKLIRYIKSR